MSTFYLDLEGGNDGADGTSFANRWKSFTAGATAARVAPGDEVRVMASPVPTNCAIDATWANATKTITLASALTKNICDCSSAWTASANVTATTAASGKKSTNYTSLAIAAGFTTGKVAYFALPATLDLSGYQQVCFWIRVNSSLGAGALQIKLCSDSVGDVAVDTLNIQIPTITTNVGISAVNRWIPIVLNKGSALGSSINSIALYGAMDPGTVTVLLDNIFAAKATSAADSLSLWSLVGKQSGSGWYAIQSISNDGLTLTVDADTNCASGGGGNYYETSETVTLYKRETIKLPHGSAFNSTTGVTEIQDVGSDGSPLRFTFGWDRTNMTTQSGETFLDCVAGFGIGLSAVNTSAGWIDLDWGDTPRLAAVRCGFGVGFTAPKSRVNLLQVSNCSNAGFVFGSANIQGPGQATVTYAILNGSNTSGGSTAGIVSTRAGASSITVTNCNGNRYGFQLADGVKIYATNVKGSMAAGILSAGPFKFYNGVISGSGSASLTSILASSGSWVGHLYNVDMQDATEFLMGTPLLADFYIHSHNHDATSEAQKIFTEGGVIVSDTVTRHSSYGYAMKFSPTSAVRSVNYPIEYLVARMKVRAGVTYSRKTWVRRDNTGITGTFMLRGGQVAGVPNDVSASISVGADTWEELSLGFTPTEDGEVEFTAVVYGGTTYSFWVDDVETSVSTDPGIANVRQGTAYTIEGVGKTGTLDLPAQSDVKIGVSFDGAGQTGTYDGSDRWSDPGVSNVRFGVKYRANALTQNRTGTLDLPYESDVRDGVSFDGTTQTGTLDLPAEADVKTGILFDGAQQIGMYDGSDRWTDPGIANVRQGTDYKANSATNNRTGTLDLPAEANVKLGVGFDGATKTGTLESTDPGEANVSTGIAYKINSVSKLGTRAVVTNVMAELALEGASAPSELEVLDG